MPARSTFVSVNPPYVLLVFFYGQHLVWFVLAVAAGQQRCYRGSWGAPVAPRWERQHHWSHFQMFLLMGKKHAGRRSWKRILPNAAGAKTQSGCEWQRAVWVLLAGERLVLRKWFGPGSASMNYWRISDDDDDDGQALMFAPSPPGRARTQQMLSCDFSGSDCDGNKAVTSPLQLDKPVLITGSRSGLPVCLLAGLSETR